MKSVMLLGMATLAFADLYMHNPRGSNDRLNEANDNRNNANRLFDSQNNNKGGYCWGDPLTYYEGSVLSIEWTAQHGCGSSNSDCQMVIQYMCSNIAEDGSTLVRDGSTTTTIPNTSPEYMSQNTGVYEYGMHESYAYYQRCSGRSRNMGLYIADRNLNGDDARFTRQENNGQRYGFECNEERDYYPYWAPSPWIDVAILTNKADKLCGTFESESQNVVSKWECVDPNDNSMPGGQDGNGPSPISQTQCEGNGGTWLETPSWDLGKPDCTDSPYSRDNHLGNGKEGYTNHYNWSLPSGNDLDCLDGDNCVCVLRLRYNISTYDVDNWEETDADGLPAVADSSTFIDWNYNGNASPLQQDPTVDVGGFNVTLALNTDQYGRIFEDRSYTFYLKSRPSDVSSTIYNLNVRGKRGNIVQVYPSVEYDFVPTFLEIPEYSWVHFHWTGCDTNPNGNAGEGTEGTDRHNIIQIRGEALNYPMTWDEYDDFSPQLPWTDEERLNFAAAGQTISDCPTYAELMTANANNEEAVEEDTSNCFVLNAAPRHFDGGVFQFGTGTLNNHYNYMCTRNNNFSNRSQKGGLSVTTAIPAYAIGLIVGGASALALGAFLGVTYYMSKVNPYSAPGKVWNKVLGH